MKFILVPGIKFLVIYTSVNNGFKIWFGHWRWIMTIITRTNTVIIGYMMTYSCYLMCINMYTIMYTILQPLRCILLSLFFTWRSWAWKVEWHVRGCVSNDRSVVVCQITASFTDCSEGQPLLSFTCVHALWDITTSPMGPDVYFFFPWNQGLPCFLPS